MVKYLGAQARPKGSASERRRRGVLFEERRRDRRLSESADVRVGDPGPSVLREYIKALVCWWCGKGPWKSLAIHTRKSHGVSAANIREMAGLFKYTSICDPSFATELAARESNMANLALIPKKRGGKGSRTLSEAGRQLYRQRLKDYMDAIGPEAALEQRRAASRVNAAKSKRPHLCSAGCGTMIPTATPKTCSPECRRLVRQRTALGWSDKRRPSA